MTRSLPSSYATGNQRPTTEVRVPCDGNDCLDAIDLLSEAGYELMDWQKYLLEMWMGYNRDGRWSAKSCANSTPRQNGKTLVICARALAEMLFYGGTVLYTSQLQKTSTETFNEMRELITKTKLKKYLAPNGIKTALGREEIVLKSGARMKFLARTRNGGDGQHGSLLIFDEAQALDPQSQESFKYAISACRTKRRGQTIYNGTPPKDSDYGLLFEGIRNRAIDGVSKITAYTEWSAGYGGRCPDVRDRNLWKRTNPSWEILITEEATESELEDTDDYEKFAHQRLGWWTGQRAAQTLIGEDEWHALESDVPDDWDKLAYGVKISSDGAIAALSVGTVTGEMGHVDFIRQEPLVNGMGWLVDWIMDPQRQEQVAVVAIDGKSGADDLARRLIASGMSRNAVVVASAEFAVNSAAMMVNSVADGLVTHCPDEYLDNSATKSVRRRIGNSGAFGFGGEHPEIIESASLALYAAKTTKRDPKRRAVFL